MGAIIPILIDFEARVGLRGPSAAKLIGTGYSTYAQYRSGLRPLPRYHKNHVQALLLLQPDTLAVLIKEHANGGSKE